jgi:hypothetical protein
VLTPSSATLLLRWLFSSRLRLFPLTATAIVGSVFTPAAESTWAAAVGRHNTPHT